MLCEVSIAQIGAGNNERKAVDIGWGIGYNEKGDNQDSPKNSPNTKPHRKLLSSDGVSVPFWFVYIHGVRA